jgi:hypothetical protein
MDIKPGQTSASVNTHLIALLSGRQTGVATVIDYYISQYKKRRKSALEKIHLKLWINCPENLLTIEKKWPTFVTE